MAISREQEEAQEHAYARLVARAWRDELFRQRFLAEPALVLRENGIVVPEGTTVEVHEARAGVRHLILPARPLELSDEQLDAVAGGTGISLRVINQSNDLNNSTVVIFQQNQAPSWSEIA